MNILIKATSNGRSHSSQSGLENPFIFSLFVFCLTPLAYLSAPLLSVTLPSRQSLWFSFFIRVADYYQGQMHNLVMSKAKMSNFKKAGQPLY